MQEDLEALELEMEKGSLESGTCLHKYTSIAQHTNPINPNGTAGHIEEEGEDGKNHLVVKEVVKQASRWH